MPQTNLAYLSSVIPSLSSTFIYREILELERRGYTLKLYALRRPDVSTLSAESLPLYEKTNYLLPVNFPELIRAHFYYAVLHPLRYLATWWHMLTPFHRSLRYRFRSVTHVGEGAVLARRMQRDNIGHVHSHYASQATSVARVVHLLTGVRYSFSAHAHDIWADRLLLREKLEEARFVACCSGCGRTELVKQGNPSAANKVHLVYHGIDIRRFAPPEPEARQENLILAVGRFESVKGFPLLIEACARLKAEGVSFQCCIVGDGDDMPVVKTLVEEYGLKGLVELPGAVPQERLLHYYHRASVFALPCIPAADGRHDGIPNVLAEAMATGLPVVSTSVGGISELVKNGEDGLLVTPGSQSELASTLKQLLQDASLRQRFSIAARTKICAHFDSQKCIEPLIELFKRECGLRPIERDHGRTTYPAGHVETTRPNPQRRSEAKETTRKQLPAGTERDPRKSLEHVDDRKLKIAWYLVGNRNTGSSRMECYRVHDHLNRENPGSSVIRWSPDTFQLDVGLSPQSELDYLTDHHIDLVVFQKVSGPNSRELASLCGGKGISSVYIICDYLENIEIASLCSATIVTSTNLFDMVRELYPDADVSYCPYATEMPSDLIPAYDRPTNEIVRIVYLGLRRIPNAYGFLNRINGTSLFTIGPYGEYDRRKASTYAKMKADLIWYLNKARYSSSSGNHGVQTRPSTYLPTTIKWQNDTAGEEMASCHIGVIPLLPEEIYSTIGNMKSNSRLVAMWSVGLATIASPLKSYVETINEGVDGFIAKSQQDWIRLIELLRDNPELRMKIGRSARKRAYEEFGFKRQCDDYFAVFKRAREKRGGVQPADSRVGTAPFAV